MQQHSQAGMQTLLDKNYFDIFGLDESYGVDRQTLRSRFRNLQKQFHPDNFSTASEQEKRLSAQYAAHINEAFTTLNDPVLRGRYMLSLLNVSIDEHTDHQMDQAFLLQQMELREELEVARSASGGMQALIDLNARVTREYDDKATELGRFLDVDGEIDTASARRLVRELQFLSRVRQEIESAEDALL